jgi:hypothetical protein
VKKGILVGLSIFTILLTATVLHWSEYHRAAGSRRTVYRVNRFTGEVTVEGTPAVGRGWILRSTPAPELEVRPYAAAAHVP